jgi:hypothetical protein
MLHPKPTTAPKNKATATRLTRVMWRLRLTGEKFTRKARRKSRLEVAFTAETQPQPGCRRRKTDRAAAIDLAVAAREKASSGFESTSGAPAIRLEQADCRLISLARAASSLQAQPTSCPTFAGACLSARCASAPLQSRHHSADHDQLVLDVAVSEHWKLTISVRWQAIAAKPASEIPDRNEVACRTLPGRRLQPGQSLCRLSADAGYSCEHRYR